MSDLSDRLAAALIDRYTIEREIGRGGMATVYLAEDLRHHRKVAIKVLRPDLAATLGPERFLREIEVAAQLQHPHILPLHDSGEADGFLYYVMPYVEGQSLRDKLAKEGELPIGDAVRILRDVVDALTEAHAHGVVHRDIKPENILLRGRHALVTDFGVAKAVSEATGREQLTTAGVALGTPAYMAPEQASADPHLDHRVDIYAVGAVAYELLTGRPVFMGTTPQMVLSAHVTEAPQPVTKHRDTVPPALEHLVMRCLEKRPADRFQSAEELLPQLEALATPSGGVTPTDTLPLAATAGKRRRLLPTVLGSVAVVIVLGFLGTSLFRSKGLTITTSNIHAVTSDPALEFYLSLSPDGSQVAFVSVRGNEWSVHLRSTRDIGTALPLTQDLPESWKYGRTYWTPDNEFIRFVAFDGAEWSWKEVARLGGTVRQPELSPRQQPSPDFSRIVEPRGDSIVSHAAGDSVTRLLFVADNLADLSPAVWSPDNRRFAWVEGNRQWLESFNKSPSSIWIIDTDSGDPVRVTEDEYMDVSPAWLDEDHLLFVSNRDNVRAVYVVEVGPSGPRGEPQTVPGVTDPHSISYSVAGRKLAFTKGRARQNIWSYPIGSGPASVADGEPVTNDNAVIEEHDISLDGRWIAYDQDLRGNMDIYKRLLEGGSPIPITDSPGDEFCPRWSPDGSEIAFYGDPSPGVNAVLVVSADGGTPVVLDSGPRWVSHPRWSPSGMDIAFRSLETGRSEVWLVSREAIGMPWGEPMQLTDFGCSRPAWAPDGSGVLCVASETREIVVVSREGAILWRYDLSMAGLREFLWPRYSWDGSMIYGYGTHNNRSRGIWAMPAQGGEPRLMVAFDDPEIRPFRGLFSVGPDRLYVTVGEWESDIWVADVEW